MKSIIILAIIFAMTSSTFQKPSFCQDYDCPEYNLIESSDEIEIREYQNTGWVSTEMVGDSAENLTRSSFYKLFNYISGQNSSKQKISMTVPVLNKINTRTPFSKIDKVATMSFFLTNSSVETFPLPNDSSVSLTNLPSKRYAVIAYSGYSNRNDQEAHLIKLGNHLVEKGLKFEKEHYFFAGYNSPFKFFGRHNEVWIELL
jgi:hypothetical protein